MNMYKITTQCVASANALLDLAISYFPSRQSKEPVGWPAVQVKIATPIAAALAIRNSDGKIVGVAEIDAHRIPRDLIQNVRQFLELALQGMDESAVKEIVDNEPIVCIDTITERVVLVVDDVLIVPRSDLAKPSPETLH